MLLHSVIGAHRVHSKVGVHEGDVGLEFCPLGGSHVFNEFRRFSCGIILQDCVHVSRAGGVCLLTHSVDEHAVIVAVSRIIFVLV